MADNTEVLDPPEYEQVYGDVEIVNRMLANCGVGELHRGASLYSVRNEQVKPALMLAELIKPSRKSRILIVSGDVGTGKTHLVCALVMELCRHQRFAIYTDARDVITRARDGACGRDDGWEKTKALYLRAKLLVLDEVPAAIGTDFQQDTIEKLVDARYRACRDTILCGNATSEAFEQAVGARVVSRAMEAGGVIVMRGDDLRGKL